MNSPILIFLNSAFKCSTKLSTSLSRINHHKGFGFILQSSTGMFIVLGWTLPPPQALGFLHRGHMKHEWLVERETSGYEAGPKIGYLQQKHCVFVHKLSRTHLTDLLDSNYVFFRPNVCSLKSPLTLKLSQAVVWMGYITNVKAPIII